MADKLSSLEENDQLLESAAYHLSGHITAIMLLSKCGIQSADLTRHKGKIGNVMRKRGDQRYMNIVEDLETEVMCVYCGIAAEYVLHQGQNEQLLIHTSSDIQDATKFIRRLVVLKTIQGVPFDYRLFGDFGESILLHRAKNIAIELWNQSIVFVNSHRETISALAEILLNQKKINEQQVALIIKKHNNI